MEDYPRTLEEFEGRFATEQACREYLMQLRWPQAFCVSPLWRAESSAQPAGPAAVWAMRLSGFGDGGHDSPGHAPAAAHLVSDHVVGDQL